jgi:hypothetical protein
MAKEDTELVEELKKLNKALNRQNVYYRRRNVILRAVATGVFTAIGTTIGFGLVILISASFLKTVSAVPFIDDILKQTKIDQLIERQLQQLETPTPTVTPTPTPTHTPIPSPTPTAIILPQL